MRKIVAGIFVSLDGVVESPEQWNTPYFSEEIGAELGSQLAVADTMLLGRVTYQEFAAYWADKGSDVPFADAINGIPKLVASTTLEKVDWQNAKLIEGDLVERLKDLKEQPGKAIITSGSVTLVGSLLRAGLVDELRLLVYPVVVGRGKRLFEHSAEPVPLELVNVRALSNGVLSLAYHQRRSAARRSRQAA